MSGLVSRPDRAKGCIACGRQKSGGTIYAVAQGHMVGLLLDPGKKLPYIMVTYVLRTAVDAIAEYTICAGEVARNAYLPIDA